MTVASELGVQKSNIVDTSNIGYVWHALCMVYCWNKEMPGLSMVPNCHHYRLRYNLNRWIAQSRSCSESNVQETWLAQKDLLVVFLITMALIAKRDFCRVSSKRNGEIVNFCIDALEIKGNLLKVDRFMLSSEKVYLRPVFKQSRHTWNIYCSYLALINAQY